MVELVIVVAILGILAAIVLPEVQGHAQQAKESAAKDNLRTLRVAIERYAVENNGVAPGYMNNDPTGLPTGVNFSVQLAYNNYLNDIPVNPLNGLKTVSAILNNADFPISADDSTGWIYKASTKEIRLNTSSSDTEGINYFDY